MKKLFGTDGMRGEAGIFPLDEKTVYIVGQSLSRQFSEKHGRAPRFVIGRDTRESGEWIERALGAGVLAANGSIESAGVITTPGVAFVTRQFGFDAGIVISASHNPFQDNGIKIFSPSGKKIDGDTERKIEADIHRASGDDNPTGEQAIDYSRSTEYQDAYLDYLVSEFPDLVLAGFKIVADCANGAASELAPRLFERLGADVTSINCRPDGKNINRDCGSLHLDQLQQKVLETGAQFGVAFDGDADRSLFVDEQGSLVDGDAVLWVMARHLQETGKLKNDTVVATVMSNLGLETALKTRDIKLLRTSVGDKYVLEELLNTGSAIGGEQSGHIIFPNKSLVGDGMMTALFLLESILSAGGSFSNAIEGFARFPQTLVNVKVREKRPFEEVGEIAKHAAQIETELGSRGRLLLRYSGTENLARVMIEGEDQADIDQQAHALADTIKRSIG